MFVCFPCKVLAQWFWEFLRLGHFSPYRCTRRWHRHGRLGGAGVVVLGIHKGGGMIFNKDGLVEPARQMIQDRDPMDFKWTDVQVHGVTFDE